jgi:S-formylglutathione hydrolase
MKLTGFRGVTGRSLVMATCAIALMPPRGSAQTANRVEADKGQVERIKVHGRSLEGNLEGDSPDRDVFVYLPPSYAGNPGRHYPVVYFLHGYG